MMSRNRVRGSEKTDKCSLGLRGIILATTFGLAGAAYGDGGSSSERSASAPGRGSFVLAQAPATRPDGGAQAELAALEKAAKAEGQVTFYAPAPEASVARVVKAFTAKYGIKAQFVSLTNSPLLQRYSAEADAGTFAADFKMVSCCVGYIEDGIKKGWLESITAANLPVLRSGEFPAKFNRGVGVVIQVAPWSIAYNSNKVKGADVPKDWPDLLNPKWKGQMLLADPRASAVYFEFFSMIIDKYGESYLAGLRDQAGNAPRYGNGIQAVQGMGAGEGSHTLPTIPSQVQGPKDKGAPVDRVTPDFTTGIEYQLLLTSRAKAKRPAAARLMVNYFMSQEGNRVFNDDPGSIGIYDTTRLPSNFQAPNARLADTRKELITKLLGF